jgi:hypothetical protein
MTGFKTDRAAGGARSILLKLSSLRHSHISLASSAASSPITLSSTDATEQIRRMHFARDREDYLGFLGGYVLEKIDVQRVR